MPSPSSSTPAAPTRTNAKETSAGPSVESNITWLLHRAAQRMHRATGEQAEARGLHLRDYIVLSALAMTPGLTQGELGKTLGLDKTTLMSQLDRLEGMGLVIRRNDLRDRRARIPEITAAGNILRAQVAADCVAVEAAAVEPYDQAEVTVFRLMLFDIIGDSEDRGSCL